MTGKEGKGEGIKDSSCETDEEIAKRERRPFVTEKDLKKIVLLPKQRILASKLHAEHPFAG